MMLELILALLIATIAAIAHYFIAYFVAPKRAKSAFEKMFVEDEDFAFNIVVRIVESLMSDRQTEGGKTQKLIDTLIVRALGIFEAYFTGKKKEIDKVLDKAENDVIGNSRVGSLLSLFLNPRDVKKLSGLLRNSSGNQEKQDNTGSNNPFG